MQAILTQYLGVTDTKPARIKVYNEDKKHIFSINFLEERLDENIIKSHGSDYAFHKAAADYFCTIQGWTGELIGGGIKNGYAFVFTK